MTIKINTFFLDCGINPSFLNYTLDVFSEIIAIIPICEKKVLLIKVLYNFGIIFPSFSQINSKLFSITNK